MIVDTDETIKAQENELINSTEDGALSVISKIDNESADVNFSESIEDLKISHEDLLLLNHPESWSVKNENNNCEDSDDDDCMRASSQTYLDHWFSARDATMKKSLIEAKLQKVTTEKSTREVLKLEKFVDLSDSKDEPRKFPDSEEHMYAGDDIPIPEVEEINELCVTKDSKEKFDSGDLKSNAESPENQPVSQPIGYRTDEKVSGVRDNVGLSKEEILSYVDKYFFHIERMCILKCTALCAYANP